MVSNARRLQSLFSQMLAAGGRHSFSMTHGLSELTASTVQARLTPLTGFEIQKKKSSEGDGEKERQMYKKTVCGGRSCTEEKACLHTDAHTSVLLYLRGCNL